METEPQKPEAQKEVIPQLKLDSFQEFAKKLRAWSTKNYLIIFLLIMAAYALFTSKKFEALPVILTAVFVAVAEDLLVSYAKGEKLFFPASAIVTGLFIGTLLPTHSILYVAGVTAFIAIISKHFVKIENRHIFNPAAFGLVAAVFLFSNIGHAWWLATSLPLIVIFGIFIAWKMKRYTLTPAYLLTYLVLGALILTILGKPVRVYPDLIDESLLFFSFFMLVEPVTAAGTEKSRAVFGIIAAVAGILLLYFSPIKQLAAVNVLLGLLIADAFVPLLNKHLR